MELNDTAVIIMGFVGLLFGFVSVIGTMVGIAIWLDRKYSARMDRLEKRHDDTRDDIQALDAKIQVLDSKVEALDAKVDALDAKVEQQGEDIRWIQRNVHALDLKVQALDAKVEQRGEDIREIQRNIQVLDSKVQALNSKIDRAQGSLDVMVFGDRGVPEPVARERAAIESMAEEPIGD